MLRLPSPPLLGLDISPDAVKLVELSQSRGKIRVEHADSEALPPGAVNDRDIQDATAVSRALHTILERSRIRTKAVATALPANTAIVKVISLPAELDEVGIEEQIRFESSQYIPYSIDAVNFDFAVLGPDEVRKGYNHVLLVACKKEAIEDRAGALEEVGLKPKIIDVKPFALWLLHEHLTKASPLARDSSGGAVILVEIGSVTTNINVFQEGHPVYSREHNFGFGRLIEEIQRRYSLDTHVAQRMERFGGLPPEYERDVLNPFARSMAQELFRSLDFFQASMPDISAGSVHLFGIGAKIPQLAEQLRQLVSFPVYVPDPFAGMEMAPQISRRFMDADRSSLAVACGLALRRISA
ncbi:type IV pilus assembly protein PilM [Acidithiobacillus ferrivorans SS3]|uniref:Type IV pilus assembly protein PilM n=1 Tax=Acidithiobacillus ferrivorans SS3 TaxID=743299 RepID=G0JN59_9PROT|nr:type IV pilus assembly protein PilM [Acidithiobacillus ferrivorans]AEM48273.1 type IV pilus assembly protein PilM [Acidithiobacillus ferrivorans SS3]MBU2768950.1 type IV pilus assembly protein PilM [Acidithiobacillus ferrivorans]MBU2852228.1 type IV pilus assembly protein PilM [Acidithiobacillus ferrivorans]OFA17128.1 pilus assembly protein PilM [Acidithiobacillus ferrivorans]